MSRKEQKPHRHKQHTRKPSLASSSLLEIMYRSEEEEIADLESLATISYEDLLQRITSFVERTKGMEKEEFDRRGRKFGYETLITDTHGGRGIDWFRSTGKLFSLGKATACIVVGLVHPDIGMAGAHRNSLRPEDSADQVIKERASKGLPVTNIPRSLQSKQDRLTLTLQIAANTAVNEFAKLSGGNLPQEGIEIVMYGLSESVPPEGNPFYRTVILRSLQSHPLITQQGIHLSIEVDFIGQAGQVVYGGPRHPKYHFPYFLGAQAG